MAIEITDRYINPAKATLVYPKRFDLWSDMFMWLADPARPGKFARQYVIMPNPYAKKLVGFQIEDKDVAFEFKMRFG